MASSELILAVVGLIAAGLVKGVTGIGYATYAMPLLALAVGLETAMAVVIVPAIASNAALMASAGRLWPTMRRFALFYAAILPGIGCGVLLLVAIDPTQAARVLGIVTIAYVALAVAKPKLALPPWLERPLALPAGFVNGALTGLTGSQILPLVPYMLALKLEPATQLQAINLAVTIASVAMGVALLTAGIMTSELAVMSVAGAVPAVAAVAFGSTLGQRLPVETLRRMTLAVLTLIGLGLIAKDSAAVLNAGLALLQH